MEGAVGLGHNVAHGLQAFPGRLRGTGNAFQCAAGFPRRKARTTEGHRRSGDLLRGLAGYNAQPYYLITQRLKLWSTKAARDNPCLLDGGFKLDEPLDGALQPLGQRP